MSKVLDFNDAWLGLEPSDGIDIVNPLSVGRTSWDIENPGLFETRVLSNPEYFSFTCKTFFDLTILPLQAVILDELWNRTFPMYIASRGFR